MIRVKAVLSVLFGGNIKLKAAKIKFKLYIKGRKKNGQ